MVTLITLVSLIFLTITSTTNGHQYNEDGWKAASAFLKESVDRTKDPCRDFYGYACGNYYSNSRPRINPGLPVLLRAEPMKAHTQMLHAKNQLITMLINGLWGINKKPDPVKYAQIPRNYRYVLQMMNYPCMRMRPMSDDEMLVETQAATNIALRDAIQGFNGSRLHLRWTDFETGNFSLLIFGLLERKFYQHFIFETTVIAENCTAKPMLRIGPPKLTKLTGWSEGAIFKKYKTITDKNEWNETDYREKAKATISMGIDLYGIAKPRLQGAPKLVKLSELPRLYPDLDLVSYFESMFREDLFDRWNSTDPQILIEGDYYLKRMGSILRKYTFENIMQYPFWKLFKQVTEQYLGIEKYQLVMRPRFLTQVREGCFNMVKFLAPEAMARQYFDLLGVDIMEWRKEVELLVHNILSAFRIFISSQDWLDARDKMSMMERLKKIKIDVGIPNWLDSIREVNAKTRPFLHNKSVLWNFYNTGDHRFEQVFRQLTRPNAGYEDPAPQIDVNAKYVQESHEIKINLGQLLPPLYHHNYPLAVKYGILGTLIAHELMHAFDDKSISAASKDGKHWLKSEIKEIFHQRKQCLVKQYSSHCYKGTKQQKCVSGSKTVNENIADIEGLKIACMAYKFALQTSGAEPPMPDFVRMSGDQAFFVSAVQMHCAKEKSGADIEEGLTKLHPPGRVRVEQSVRNFPIFGQAFGCVKGSKYAPNRICSLWGQFVSPNQCDQDDYDDY